MRNLLEFARGSFFNWVFIGGYFLLNGLFTKYTEELPIYLAIAILLALVIEWWALYYKARAVQYRLSLRAKKVPKVFYSVFFFGIRIAIFGVLFQVIFNSFGLESFANAYFDAMIIFLMMREGVVYLYLNAKPKKKNLKAPNFYFETVADLVLVFVMLIAYMFMEPLFAIPAIDLSWSWFSIIFITIVFTTLYFLFYVPFRVVYIYEEWHAKKFSPLHILSIIGMIYIFLAPLFYSSNRVEEDFLEYLARRDSQIEVVYNEKVRLDPSASGHICEIDGLKKLELKTVYSDYFDPCIQKMLSLEYVDLSNNRLARWDINDLVNLEYLDLSQNEIHGLIDLYGKIGGNREDDLAGLKYVDLSYNRIDTLDSSIDYLKGVEYLDLSYNPLDYVDLAIFNLEYLRVLKLEGVELSEESLNVLKEGLPNTEIVH